MFINNTDEIVDARTFNSYLGADFFDEEGNSPIKVTYSKYRHFLMPPNQSPLLFLKDTMCTQLICCLLHSNGLLGSFDNLSSDPDIVQLGTALQILNNHFDL